MAIKEKVDFQVYAKKFDSHRNADLSLVDSAINSLNLERTMRVLDFGCGTGNYLKTLQIKKFTNLFGLDQSDEMCKIASRKTIATIKKGSHTEIPYDNDFFDAVIIVDVVHFIDDIASLFNNLYRVCKKNSRIFVATQSHDQLNARIYSEYFPTTTVIDKVRHHEIIKIVSVGESHGFSLISVEDYLANTDFLVDRKYFDLIKNKAFYILGLLSDEEFDKGIARLELDIKEEGFIAKFPGRTLLTFEKE